MEQSLQDNHIKDNKHNASIVGIQTNNEVHHESFCSSQNMKMTYMHIELRHK